MTILVSFVGGLLVLVVGAELLVRGASRLAVSAGISPLVVGLTVVAFGTSSPELAVSVQSAYAGRVDLALGNVVGSNIFNVLFILGLSALVAPLVVSLQVVRQEVPVMIGASLLLVALVLDGGISRLDAALLTALIVGYTVFLVVQARRSRSSAEVDAGVDVGSAWDRHWGVQVLLVLAGLGLLVLGSHWLVNAAVAFAQLLGVSEIVIGLTIVAAGTSMPEVATSVMATLRGHRDIAVGNVIGSNVFNILAVLGISGLVAPTALAVAPEFLQFNLPVMVAVALLCLPIFFTGSVISRGEGALLLASYAAYTAYLVLDAQGSEWLPGYRQVMLWYVVPATVLALLWLTVAAWRKKGR